MRIPIFHHLRVDKLEVPRASVGAYLDVQNVYNQAKTSKGTSYNYNSTLSTYINHIPILPSIGVRVEM